VSPTATSPIIKRRIAILLIHLLWGERAARRHGSRENSPRSRNS